MPWQASTHAAQKMSFQAVMRNSNTIGCETRNPSGYMLNTGKIITGRYTDIWVKDKTGWHRN